METVNDFGTVDFFAVQTLTTGIFSVWLESNNAGGAAQIASVVLALVILLVTLEKLSRRKVRFFNLSRQHRPVERKRLSGWAGALALGLCLVPFSFGFILPAGVIATHALKHPEAWSDRGLLDALWNTVSIGGIAAFLTVLAGVFMVYGARLSGRGLPRMLMPITTIGYAARGGRYWRWAS